jgi:hypothetical protein
MEKQNVIRYFGSQKATAAALGLGKAAVSRWGDVIPLHQAYRLNKLTDGDLAVCDPFFPEHKFNEKGQ